MSLYLEYGGGLGDIFYQMYERRSYLHLNNLNEQNRGDVVLVTHNPFARELFDWHPQREFFKIRDLGYWMIGRDDEMRRRLKLPARDANMRLPAIEEGAIEFHMASDELKRLNEFTADTGDYVVLAASAGENDRSFPMEVQDKIQNWAHMVGYNIVALGKSYTRNGRFEVSPLRPIINKIDEWTVPATAELVRRSKGIITCHSGLNILGWLENKPTLLLYPPSVRDGHVKRRDKWVFGIDRANTVHAEFGDFIERSSTECLCAFNNEVVNFIQ